MIVLDTNVLSEVLRPAPEQRVLTWLEDQSRSALFTTTVTRGEIFYGLRLLPAGARRQNLWDATQIIFNDDFAGRVLSFDNDAADAYADIAASRRSQGKPISQFDAMIAAVVRSRGAVLATRNVKDFIDCGIEIVDPWNA
jgi:toxin FitB